MRDLHVRRQPTSKDGWIDGSNDTGRTDFTLELELRLVAGPAKRGMHRRPHYGVISGYLQDRYQAGYGPGNSARK